MRNKLQIGCKRSNIATLQFDTRDPTLKAL